jgi:hypothetical protein
MTYWVIEELSVTRKQYVVESYTEEGALELYKNTKPVEKESISDEVFTIHPINLFEYERNYKDRTQMDWVGSSMKFDK